MAIQRPARLLYLRDTPFVCGPGKTIINTARWIDPTRFSLCVRVPVTDRRPNAFVERLRERDIDAAAMPVHHLVPGVAQLVRLLKSERIDIVQSHDFLTRRLAVPAAALAGVAHVTSVHGWITNSMKEHVGRRLDQWLIARATKAIAVSALLRDQLLDVGVPADRVHLLPNAIVLDDYPLTDTPPAVAKVHLGLPPDSEVVTIVGRLSPEKGHALFLEMCSRIAARRSSTMFLVVGHGPLREALERDARSRGLTDRVRFLGLRDDMHHIYSATDVLTLCSTTEGLPNVVLEAFAYRRPVVATRVGGVPDLVADGRTGVLVESGDVEALTAGVMRMLEDRDLAAACGNAGRRLIETSYDFKARTAAVESLYDEVLAATSVPARAGAAHVASRGGR